MAVHNNMKESWYLQITESLETFCQKVDEKIDKEQQQLRACKKKNELETKLAQEMKLNTELKQQLDELNNRSEELERVCASFGTLTIAESDKNRLDNAKDIYELAKELTGVRFDFSAPSNVVKGYVKNEARRLLQPFELEAGDCEALWTIIRNAAHQGWMMSQDKENKSDNI